MSEPYMGEIRMFTGKYAPVNWAMCGGGLLNVYQYPALLAILGTTYGGDGRVKFALPNLGGCVPVGTGVGPGLPSSWPLGMHGGVETVGLQASHLSHTHTMRASSDEAVVTSPGDNVLGILNEGKMLYSDAADPRVALNTDSVGNAPGEGLPHDNMMPFTSVNFIICLDGNYPPRSGQEE